MCGHASGGRMLIFMCLSLMLIDVHVCMNISPPFTPSLATVLERAEAFSFQYKSIFVYFACLACYIVLVACLHCITSACLHVV